MPRAPEGIGGGGAPGGADRAARPVIHRMPDRDDQVREAPSPSVAPVEALRYMRADSAFQIRNMIQ